MREFATGGECYGGAESDVMAGGAALLATPTRNAFRYCLESHQVLRRPMMTGLRECGCRQRRRVEYGH